MMIADVAEYPEGNAMTSDYQSGASAMREVCAAELDERAQACDAAIFHSLSIYLKDSLRERGISLRKAAQALRELALPDDPASSEGADAISDKTVQDAVIAMVRRGFEREGRTTFDTSWRPDEDDLDSMRAALTAVWPAARDAEIATLREELLLWHSVFPDIAPESVLPDRSKLEAEIATLRAALEKKETP